MAQRLRVNRGSEFSSQYPCVGHSPVTAAAGDPVSFSGLMGTVHNLLLLLHIHNFKKINIKTHRVDYFRPLSYGQRNSLNIFSDSQSSDAKRATSLKQESWDPSLAYINSIKSVPKAQCHPFVVLGNRELLRPLSFTN